LPLALEQFQKTKKRTPRAALRDLLTLDADLANFRLTATAATGKPGSAHVVCVNGAATADWQTEKAFIDALGKRGIGVTVVDPRGVGKLRPAGLQVRGHDYADPLCGVEENIAYNAFLVGKNLLGMRVADVLKAVASLREDGKPGRVILCGRQDAALVAIFAAAIDPMIDAVAVESLQLSFRSFFEPEGTPINAASILPRMLRDYGDITDVLSAIAPRRVLVAGISGKPEALIENVTRAENRLSTDGKILLEWLSM
jgi:hypothetical protein